MDKFIKKHQTEYFARFSKDCTEKRDKSWVCGNRTSRIHLFYTYAIGTLEYSVEFVQHCQYKVYNWTPYYGGVL